MKKMVYDFAQRIILDGNRKGDICNNEGIDLFIDDNTLNCKAVMEKGVPTIQMECAFTTQSKGLKRVTDWNEVYELIQEMCA